MSARHEVHLWAVRQPEARPADDGHVREVCAELRVFERTPMPVPRHWIAPAPESWFHSARLEVALAEAYTGGTYDLVHLDEMCLTRSVLDLGGPPEVLHHHKLDVELARALHLVGKTTLVETMRWRALEELAAARFEQHVFCTREDAEAFGERHPRVRTHVVPNGVDLEYFAPREVERDPRELLFLGSLDYAPNLDGLERFFTSVWPRLRERLPDVSLVVVGRAPGELLGSLPRGVHLIPDVDDVRPFLARAAALVVPLEIGGGSRLKIAEALAMGCPVVSTATGATGYDASALRVVPRVADLTSALTAQLRAPSGIQPGEAQLAELDWSGLAERLSAVWDACAPST